MDRKTMVASAKQMPSRRKQHDNSWQLLRWTMASYGLLAVRRRVERWGSRKDFRRNWSKGSKETRATVAEELSQNSASFACQKYVPSKLGTVPSHRGCSSFASALSVGTQTFRRNLGFSLADTRLWGHLLSCGWDSQRGGNKVAQFRASRSCLKSRRIWIGQGQTSLWYSSSAPTLASSDHSSAFTNDHHGRVTRVVSQTVYLDQLPNEFMFPGNRPTAVWNPGSNSQVCDGYFEQLAVPLNQVDLLLCPLWFYISHKDMDMTRLQAFMVFSTKIIDLCFHLLETDDTRHPITTTYQDLSYIADPSLYENRCNDYIHYAGDFQHLFQHQ